MEAGEGILAHHGMAADRQKFCNGQFGLLLLLSCLFTIPQELGKSTRVKSSGRYGVSRALLPL